MGIVKKLFGFFSPSKDDGIHDSKPHEESSSSQTQRSYNHLPRDSGRARRGLSVQSQVPVDRPQLPPLLTPTPAGEGGVQGLSWFAQALTVDEDGDVADEFLEEVCGVESGLNDESSKKPAALFRVNRNTRPVKLKEQIISSDGNVQHIVEIEGELRCI